MPKNMLKSSVLISFRLKYMFAVFSEEFISFLDDIKPRWILNKVD